MTYNTRSGKYMTSYLMAIVVFALALIIYKIFTHKIKCTKFYLENDSQGQGVEKRDLCQLTGNILLYIAIFSEF